MCISAGDETVPASTVTPGDHDAVGVVVDHQRHRAADGGQGRLAEAEHDGVVAADDEAAVDVVHARG